MGTYVFDFAEGDKDQKDLLGGKGANLAEMTNLGLPVPPGFTISTEACRAYLSQGDNPAALADEVSEHLASLEKTMGRRLGDPDDPLLVSVRSGAKFSMPGMMETVLNIGLNDESIQGLARQSDDERFAMDSYRRLLSMFGGTVLGIDGEHFSEALDDLKDKKGTAEDLDLDVDDLRGLVETFKGLIREHAGPRVPSGPARADGPGGQGRLRLVEHRPGRALPPSGADPRGPRHRRQHPGDGLRQPRHDVGLRRLLHPRPGQRQPGRVRRLPPERPGRGRRRGHPQHRVAGRHGDDRQAVARRAARHHGQARGALPRHVRHRVHRRAGQALDAPDPRRQAHARGGVPDRGAHGRRGPHRHGRGAAPGHRRAAREPDVPALRRQGRADPAGQGDERVPRARPSARRSSTGPPRSSGPRAART